MNESSYVIDTTARKGCKRARQMLSALLKSSDVPSERKTHFFSIDRIGHLDTHDNVPIVCKAILKELGTKQLLF